MTMKNNLLKAAVLFIFTSIIMNSCGGPSPIPGTEPAAVSGQIRLDGSIKVGPLAEALGEVFTSNHPDVTFEVLGGGSKAGVIATGDGSVDIGLASRDIKAAEYEEFPSLVPHTIAFDSIAVVTHPGIKLGSLNVEQVKDIFAGEITNFSQVGGPDAPIKVITYQDGSPAKITFQDLVMEYGEVDKTITEAALVNETNEQVRSTLSETPNTIGYLPIRFLDESIQAIPIDNVPPSVANIHNGTYKVVRPLNMISSGPPEGLIKVYLDWVKSEEGQDIVSRDYITILADFE